MGQLCRLWLILTQYSKLELGLAWVRSTSCQNGQLFRQKCSWLKRSGPLCMTHATVDVKVPKPPLVVARTNPVKISKAAYFWSSVRKGLGRVLFVLMILFAYF